MKTKVLLVNPSNNYRSEIHPIGLLSLGTYLEKQGYNVKIMDGACGHEPILYASNYMPDVVAIGGMTPHIINGYKLSQFFKSFINSYNVIGGVHATALPHEAKRFADAVIVGEGEGALPELIDGKDNGIFKGIPLDNLDEIPNYNYNLIDFEHYANIRKCQHTSIWSFVLPWDRVMATSTSRGCPFRCTYCHNSYTKIPVRFRSIDRIVEELKYLKRKKINAVHFIDDTIMLNKKRMNELFTRIADEHLGMYYSVSARSSDINDDMLEVLTRAGVVQIAFGFESGSQRILDVLNKGTKVEDNKNAIDLCNKHGIVIQGSFMFGNPTETLEEMEQTLQFIRSNYMDGGIGAFITTPYPGTKLWDTCMENQWIPKDINWETLAFNTTWVPMHKVPREDFMKFMSKVQSEVNDMFISREVSRFGKAKKRKKVISK